MTIMSNIYGKVESMGQGLNHNAIENLNNKYKNVDAWFYFQEETHMYFESIKVILSLDN